MIIRFTKRADLIAALEARRPWAAAIDKRTTAEHKADEKAAQAKFQTECRRLAKLSYADLKAEQEALRYGHVEAEFEPPSCPVSQEARIDEVLAALAHTRQEQFNLSDERGSAWSTAYWLLTHDENAHKTVCP